MLPHRAVLSALRERAREGHLPAEGRAGEQQQDQPIRIRGSLKRVWRLRDGSHSGARLKGDGAADAAAAAEP